MFESLKSINERVFNRAKTVEKNIKAASNSFYDSYLDLTEELLKTIAEAANIELTTRMTCGDILRCNDFKSFLTETLKLDDYTYGKLCDYTLKINAQKHKNEKNVQIETIVNYLRVLHLIHYTISKTQSEFLVPDGVICLGKHCFYACDNLRKIVVPKSVIRFENNPFSGCEHLSVESHTPYYIIENGVIYNKFKTTIVGCLNGSQIDCLRIPESVTLISRNSFWNCKCVKKIVITKNVDKIGYNPFAGCENLIIESKNDNFVVKNGIVYDKTFTHILCATDKAIGKNFTIPNGITHINRGVFSGCKSLENIDFNGVTYIDKSSFTNCVGLTDIYVPDTVTYIGEWAFAYCVNLKKVSIGKNTFVDKNAFNECSAVIERRN